MTSRFDAASMRRETADLDELAAQLETILMRDLKPAPAAPASEDEQPQAEPHQPEDWFGRGVSEPTPDWPIADSEVTESIEKAIRSPVRDIPFRTADHDEENIQSGLAARLERFQNERLMRSRTVDMYQDRILQDEGSQAEHDENAVQAHDTPEAEPFQDDGGGWKDALVRRIGVATAGAAALVAAAVVALVFVFSGSNPSADMVANDATPAGETTAQAMAAIEPEQADGAVEYTPNNSKIDERIPSNDSAAGEAPPDSGVRVVTTTPIQPGSVGENVTTDAAPRVVYGSPTVSAAVPAAEVSGADSAADFNSDSSSAGFVTGSVSRDAEVDAGAPFDVAPAAPQISALPSEQAELEPAAAGERDPDAPIASAPVTTAVNMRSGPDNSAGTITVVPTGSEVDVVGCDQWCDVYYQGERGFIYKSFVVGADTLTASRQ